MEGKRIKLFDPIHPYLHKYVEGYEAVALLQPVFRDGKQTSKLPNLADIREHHSRQLELFWPEYLRKLNPEAYPVDLSVAAWEQKMELIKQHRG
ncbi:nicotinate phosphoribosyltransferase [compost metagenome]